VVEPDDRHRRLGRDPGNLTEEVAIEHQIPHHEDPFLHRGVGEG
jgi:hypothetical protein